MKYAFKIFVLSILLAGCAQQLPVTHKKDDFCMQVEKQGENAVADDYQNSLRIASYFNEKYSAQKNRKLLVFMDGTLNDASSNTNIWKMYNLSIKDACSGNAVIPFYEVGLGSRPRVPEFFDAAFGAGAGYKIRRAYRFLSEAYQTNDEIYIFGFSRGAFTARSLNGLIEFGGLLTRESINAHNFFIKSNLFGLYDQYLVHDSGQPDFEEALKAKIKKWREENKLHIQDDIKVKAIGVFDTVPALGVFENTDPDNHRLQLYAHQGFHALALDEQRIDFRPLRFYSADISRGEHVTEVWFPGVHANVGGGYSKDCKAGVECGLEYISLNWMVANFKKYKLFTQYSPQSDQTFICGKLHDEFFESLDMMRYVPRLLQGSAILRRMPNTGDKLHESIFDRMNIDPLPEPNPDREPDGQYRPINLRYTKQMPIEKIDETLRATYHVISEHENK